MRTAKPTPTALQAASSAHGKKRWVIFDYGVGNLHSLLHALEVAGADARVSDQVAELEDADVAVLPGVGAFGAVMTRLEGAREVLRERHRQGRPVLGICIGQQVLYEASEEDPGVPGLGVLRGQVRRLPAAAGKIPHMGWNQLDIAGKSPLLDGVATGSHVYYVHSFAAMPDAATVATTEYGAPFAAAVQVRATVGYQFHPEKSGPTGRRILANTVAVLEALA